MPPDRRPGSPPEGAVRQVEKRPRCRQSGGVDGDRGVSVAVPGSPMELYDLQHDRRLWSRA